MDMSEVIRGMGSLEAKLEAFAQKAEAEIKNAGTVSVETKPQNPKTPNLWEF